MTPRGAAPYGQLRYQEIAGKQMAYVDEGHGDAIVFQHGNPTSSYLWRNVMPHLEGLGRLVACDLIGMGASDKLSPSGSADQGAPFNDPAIGYNRVAPFPRMTTRYTVRAADAVAAGN